MAGSQDEKINYKVFNDPVHGSIQVHPLAVCIIDTPLFQRLRYVKQMGGVCHVYPGGTHTRFEHSIGVYHLAGKVVNALKDNQPELKITEEQAMCVQLAGLCHDLGHGPFSHLFEIVANELLEDEEKWTHEGQSERIVDYLFKKEKYLCEEFKRKGYGDEHLQMIKDMIRGNKEGFLYEIVCNSESGMDVDKWDYFARDAYHLGMNTSFEHNRLIFHLKVLPKDEKKGGPLHICVRDKEQYTVFTMFSTRYALHKTVCQHPVSEGVQMMIGEALALGAKHLRFAGKEGKPKTVLQALKDLEAYTKLHDGIYHMILNYPTPEPSDTPKELTDAKKLLERIEKKDLWKCVGQLVPQNNLSDTSSALTENVTSVQASIENLMKKLTNAQDLNKKKTSAQEGGTDAQDLTKELQAEITSAQALMKEREKKLNKANSLRRVLKDQLVIEDEVTEKLKRKLYAPQDLTKELDDAKRICKVHMRKGVDENILDELTKELNLKVLKKQVNSPQDGPFKARWTSKDFGRKAENPLKNISFFDKDGKIIKDEMKLLTAPNQYSLTAIRVYWTGPQKELTDKIQTIKDVLNEFASENKLRLTNGHE